MSRTAPPIPLALILGALIAGCGLLSRTGPGPTATAPRRPTATASPSPTPTPEPGIVLLLTDEDSELPVGPLIASLEQLTAGQGLALEQRELEDTGQLSAQTQLVISMGSPSDLTGMASEYPEAHFVGIGQLPEEAPANLSGMVAPKPLPLMEAFLAGFGATVITDNYRVAVIVPEGEDRSEAIRRGFRNGVRFYCGLCRPARPPNLEYPLERSAPPDLTIERARFLAEDLVAEGVSSVYLAPGLEETPLANALADLGIVLAAQRRPSGIPDSAWAFAIRPAPERAIETHWEAALGGTPDSIWPLRLIVDHRNPTVASNGRARVIAEIQDDLNDGFIDPGDPPR